MSAGRLASAALAFCAFALYGMVRTSKHRARARMLASLCSDVKEMDARISAERMPLVTICERLSRQGESAAMWSQIYIAMANGDAFPYAFAHAEDNIQGTEEREIMRELAASLGSGDAESAVKRLRFAYGRLEELSNKLRNEADRKEKLPETLSILAGIGVALILM